jgi:hypothetical protein
VIGGWLPWKVPGQFRKSRGGQFQKLGDISNVEVADASLSTSPR